MADAPATATSSSASRRRGAEVPYLPLLFSLTTGGAAEEVGPPPPRRAPPPTEAGAGAGRRDEAVAEVRGGERVAARSAPSTSSTPAMAGLTAAPSAHPLHPPSPLLCPAVRARLGSSAGEVRVPGGGGRSCCGRGSGGGGGIGLVVGPTRKKLWTPHKKWSLISFKMGLSCLLLISWDDL